MPGDAVDSATTYLRGLQRSYGDLTRIRWEIPKSEIDFDKELGDPEFVRKLRVIHGEDKTLDELRAILEGPLVEPDKTHFISRHILSGLPARESNLLQTIPIGALPTNDANAAAIKTPSGHPAIVVNVGMLRLLHRFSTAFLGSQPTSLSPAMWSDRQAMYWIVQGCVAMATGAARVGYDRIPSFTDPMRMTASSSLDDCAIAFIIGHEYGHVQLGHLSDGSCSVKHLLSDPNAPDLEVYKKAYEQEFAADRRGTDLAVIFNQQTHRPPSQLVYFAIACFFQLVRTLDICAGSILDRTSHPDPAARWAAINSAIRSKYDDQMESDIANLEVLFGGVRAGAEMISSPRENHEKP